MTRLLKSICVLSVISLSACGKKTDEEPLASPNGPQSNQGHTEEKDKQGNGSNGTSNSGNGQGTPVNEGKTELAADTNFLIDTNYVTYGSRLGHSHIFVAVQVPNRSISITKIIIDGVEVKQNGGAAAYGDGAKYEGGTVSKQAIDALVMSDRWNQEVIDRENRNKAETINRYNGGPYFYVRGFSMSPPSHPEVKLEVKEGSKAPTVLVRKF